MSGIAGRKREAEEASRMETVVRDSNDAITIQNSEGTITAWNHGAELIFGYSEQEALQMNIARLTPADKEEEQKEFIRRLFAGEKVTSFETQRLTKDGRILDVWLTVTKLMDDAGKVIGIASTERDITGRKRVERALRESEARYKAILESAAEGILVADLESRRFNYANPAICRMLGYTPEELTRLSVADIHPKEELPHVISEFEAQARGEKALASAIPCLCKNGDVIYADIVTAMVVMDKRKCNVGFFSEITERKQAEAKREMLEEQLRVSQKMDAIGNLAGGIAHDFNNLLSVILSYTQFVLDGVNEGDPKRDDLLEVKKAAERAASLTRQLLAFGRKQVLQPVPLNLNQVAGGVEKMLQRILGEDISLVQALAPDLGLTLADPGQIEQVLMNLVVNARDAMAEGGKLTIKTSNVEVDEEFAARHVAVKPGPYVLLEVSDTGSGMDKQTQARIFEPFFTTKEKGKGTGLGLPMVYGIIKQSGGNIWVYSEPGRGTTFKIFLPRELSAVAAAIKPPVVLGLAVGTETILLVEDEEALRKVAKRALDAAGYTVLIAEDGDEAIRASGRHEGDIHLLLTDVVMPGMNGRTLAKGLSKTRPALKVLYMSGYTDDAIIRHGVLDAGTHFLEKPFTSADLTRSVREVLDEGLDNLSAGLQAIQPGAEREEQPLDRDALRGLPKGLLDKLRQAVVAARYDEIIGIVGTIRLTQPDVAAGLGRMAELYDYVGLRDLLGRGEEGTK